MVMWLICSKFQKIFLLFLFKYEKNEIYGNDVYEIFCINYEIYCLWVRVLGWVNMENCVIFKKL